jgi:hypothetical protein
MADPDMSSGFPVIREAALDAQWRTGLVNLDGAQVPYMTIIHPRFGEISILMSRESCEKMSNCLLELCGAPRSVPVQGAL